MLQMLYPPAEVEELEFRFECSYVGQMPQRSTSFKGGQKLRLRLLESNAAISAGGEWLFRSLWDTHWIRSSRYVRVPEKGKAHFKGT